MPAQMRPEFPALAERMAMRTAVLDWRSRNLELPGADTPKASPGPQ
jgi:hypothetical protein